MGGESGMVMAGGVLEFAVCCCVKVLEKRGWRLGRREKRVLSSSEVFLEAPPTIPSGPSCEWGLMLWV